MITAGIDAGSRAVKIVLYDSEPGEVLAGAVADQSTDQKDRARELFAHTVRESGLDETEIRGIVATGYARDLIDFADTTVTEITCHGAGVHRLLPSARTVIEIGGQDSKLLRLQQGGAVRDFAMNDRCAAGTGRFLEIVAARFGVPLARLGAMAGASAAPVEISSMCVVFAETEIIGLMSQGAAEADIVAGVQAAIAARVAAMAGRNVEAPVAFTGGVALVGGMAEALAAALGCPVEICPSPQRTGALGAAILAARRAE